MFKRTILTYDVQSEVWVLYVSYFFVFKKVIGIYDNATDAINAAKVL